MAAIGLPHDPAELTTIHKTTSTLRLARTGVLYRASLSCSTTLGERKGKESHR